MRLLERHCCSKTCVIADVLLCHDDELEGRRIAFILYLMPAWEKSDGGTLDLYSTDGKSLELSPRWLEEVILTHPWQQLSPQPIHRRYRVSPQSREADV